MKRSAPIFLLSLALSAPLLAQPEFRVNANNDPKPHAPAAAFSSDGGFLVAWSNDRDGVVARSYTPAGQPRGGDLTLAGNVNLPQIPGEGNVVSQKEAAVVASGDGFFVFWTSEKAHLTVDFFHETREVTDRDVFGQRFDRTGHAVGARFAVNQTAAGWQNRPRALAFGNKVVVVWQTDDEQATTAPGEGVFGRVFDTAGRAQGNEFRVGVAGWYGGYPALAADASGGFAVAFEGPDANGRGVYVRFYDAAARPRGRAVAVNSTTEGGQGRPGIAQNAAGDFVVLWQGQFENPRKTRIYSQRVARDGSRLGGEARISDGDLPWHLSPLALFRQGADPAAAWVEWSTNFPIGIYGEPLTDTGLPVGAKGKLNVQQIGAQYQLGAATNARGDLLLVWEGYNGGQKPGITAKVTRANP